MSYSLTTLWHDRQRYIPGVLAVAFSTLLIALQCGLLIGLFSITSMPIDRNDADVWMGGPGVLSVDLGRPIRENYIGRMEACPEIERADIYMQGFAYWAKPTGATELCMVIGSRLNADTLGTIKDLTPRQRELLTEPGAVIIDRSDVSRLGVKGIGDVAEVTGTRVRVVDLTTGIKSLAGPYLFCSIATARTLLKNHPPGHVSYVLGKCKNPADARMVADRLQDMYTDPDTRSASNGGWRRFWNMWFPGTNTEKKSISVFTKDEFSTRSRVHWLTKTKAGIALGYAAALGLLVGAVVTSQTLYAATAASLREFAVLRALGVPRWRMAVMVMSQSFWIGVIGITLALPVVFVLQYVADRLTVSVDLPGWLLCGTAVVTLVMALGSGLAALRSLRDVEPATLLR